MKTYAICTILIGTAALAACGSADDGGAELRRQRGGDTPAASSSSNKSGGQGSAPVTPGAPATPGDLPTNSAAGKAFYATSVHPFLEQKCSGCHTQGGIGNPTWLVKSDPAKSYELIYAQSFATAASRVVLKGEHSGGAAPALTGDERSKWAQWIALETKDGGQKAQANVLEKFGSCFDKAKFDAIGFGTLRTIRRDVGNNPMNAIENRDKNGNPTNDCTGCDNAPCRTCHASDDATGFIMAIGDPVFPADYTFEQTKRLEPAFIREYVSTSPSGQPQFNPGVLSKSINTVEKAKAYQHPMFVLTPAMKEAIEAFVADAVDKYSAGSCGK